jgi:hypothetical protein
MILKVAVEALGLRMMIIIIVTIIIIAIRNNRIVELLD